MADKKITELTAYTAPIDTDLLGGVDITAGATKKFTWAGIKATLKTYFDALYSLLSGTPADHSYVGHATNTYLSGATVAQMNLVFMGTGGKWLLVDADAVATCKGLLGIALEAKNDTEAMLVALPGSFVRDDTWNWTIGDTLYAGETPGAIQNTIPTGADAIIRVVGFAVTADIIYFNPSSDQQSTVA